MINNIYLRYLRFTVFITVFFCLAAFIVPSVSAEGSSVASRIPESFPVWVLLLIIGILFTILCVLGAVYFFRESKRHVSRFLSMNRKKTK